MKSVFFHRFSKNIQNIKFQENSSSGSRAVLCGRTDRHDEATSRFSQFGTGLKCIQSSNLHSNMWPLKAKWYHLLTPLNVQTYHGSGGWVTSLSTRMTVFYSRRIHVGFGVDKVVVGQVYFQALQQFFFCKYHATNALYSFTHPSPTLHNLSNWER